VNDNDMDMGQTIRHPNVVVGRIEAITDRIGHLREQLAIAEDELRQMTGIVAEMWEVKPWSQIVTDAT
jgi:hypothetical protein